MKPWVHLPPEACVHITADLLDSRGLPVWYFWGVSMQLSTTVAYIFHAYPSHRLNCDEHWRSIGFSYTIKIKPIHVHAVGETLRHVGHTEMQGLWKARTRAGLIWASCSLEVVLAVCQMLYFMSVGDNLNAEMCQCAGKYVMDDTTWVVTCLQALFMSNHDHFLQIFLPFFQLMVLWQLQRSEDVNAQYSLTLKGNKHRWCMTHLKTSVPIVLWSNQHTQAGIKIYINMSRTTLISFQVLTHVKLQCDIIWEIFFALSCGTQTPIKLL